MGAQASLLASLRLESSGLRRQIDVAEGKCEVACQTARDFREHNLQLKQQLREVEAHLAMLLDAREAEKDSHDAEVELLQEELALKHAELIKREKLFQKKISSQSGTAEPAAETGVHRAAELTSKSDQQLTEPIPGTDCSAAYEPTLVDSYAQTDSDAVLFPLRVAARKLQEDIRKAEETFRTTIAQTSDR